MQRIFLYSSSFFYNLFLFQPFLHICLHQINAFFLTSFLFWSWSWHALYNYAILVTVFQLLGMDLPSCCLQEMVHKFDNSLWWRMLFWVQTLPMIILVYGSFLEYSNVCLFNLKSYHGKQLLIKMRSLCSGNKTDF